MHESSRALARGLTSSTGRLDVIRKALSHPPRHPTHLHPPSPSIIILAVETSPSSTFPPITSAIL